MLVYRISNPSDAYTMEAESFAAAVMAIAILGEGRYGLIPLNHDGPGVPICLIGDYPTETYQAAGVTNLDGLSDLANTSPEFNEYVAAALDSVRIGDLDDRARPKSDHEKLRTSANNIGRYAWKYAEAMRGQREFAPICAEAGNS